MLSLFSQVSESIVVCARVPPAEATNAEKRGTGLDAPGTGEADLARTPNFNTINGCTVPIIRENFIIVALTVLEQEAAKGNGRVTSIHPSIHPSIHSF